MKKKIFMLICALTLLLSGCGSTPEHTEPTDAENPTLTTPQSGQKTVYVHRSITRTDAASSVNRTEYIYNDKDLLTEIVITDKNGAEKQRYQVTCDEYGNPKEWSTTLGDVKSSISYEFDSCGHSLGTYAYSNDTLITSTEYTWSGDLRISYTVKSPAQGLEQRIEYSYDEKGKLVRQDQYTDGVLSAYALCTCDDQGRLLISKGYDLEDQLTSTITCTYEGNTETRITTLTDGTVMQRQQITYDDHNNLLTNTFYDGEGKLLTTETHTWIPIQVPEDSPRASI